MRSDGRAQSREEPCQEALQVQKVSIPQVICRTPRGRPIAWAVRHGDDFTVIQREDHVKNEWADYEDWVQLAFDFNL